MQNVNIVIDYRQVCDPNMSNLVFGLENCSSTAALWTRSSLKFMSNILSDTVVVFCLFFGKWIVLKIWVCESVRMNT